MTRRATTTRGRIPILEHPGRERGLIEPSRFHSRAPRIPARGVMSFFHDEIERRAEAGRLTKLTELRGEGPPIPVYEVGGAATPSFLCWAGLTAPLSAVVLEELVALGARSVLACGGAGALDGSLPAGHLVLPTSAVRHEGTSYHYQPRGHASRPHPTALGWLRDACSRSGLPWIEGATWTTDGVFRETPSMIRRRRKQGCLTVEMEAAALFAVARFRKVVLGQILYAADDVSGAAWDERGWRSLRDVRSGMIDLCLDAVAGAAE